MDYDKLKFWLAVATAVVMVLAAWLAEVGLLFGVPLLVSIVISIAYLARRWEFRNWRVDSREPGKSSAPAASLVAGRKAFLTALNSTHLGVQISLWGMVVGALVIGVAARHAPTWLSSELRVHLTEEAPATHPALNYVEKPASLAASAIPPDETIILVTSPRGWKFEAALAATRDVILKRVVPIATTLPVLLLLVGVIIVVLWFADLMGKRTYKF